MKEEMKSFAKTSDVEKLGSTLTWRMIVVAGIAQAIGVSALRLVP